MDGVVELTDDLNAVEAMLTYLYEHDYSSARTPCEPTNLHAKVYILADKYGIPDLKILAQKYFHTAAEGALNPQNLTTARLRRGTSKTSSTS